MKSSGEMALTTPDNKIQESFDLSVNKTVEITTSQGSKFPQIAATLIVTFAHFTSGYAMGWTSSALSMLKNEGQELTPSQAGWVGSLFCVGAAIATPLAGVLADRWGRKRTAVATAIPFIISWTLTASASHIISLLYIARLSAGVSAGTLTTIAPMYVAEIAEPSVRGALSSILLVMFNLGLLAVYVVGAAIDSYLMLALLGFIPVAIFLAGALWLPESPALLASKGRISEARKSLRKLRGEKCDIETELRLLEIAAKEDHEASAEGSLLRLVRKSRGLRRGLIVTLGQMTCQQLSGIAAILSYTADIFKASGSEIDANTSAVVFGAVQVVFTFVSTLVLDRAGRRPLIIGSAGCMLVTLATLGGYFEARNAGLNVEAFGWIPLVALSLYIVFFSVGMGPVPWVLAGEVFPARARGAGVAVVSMWAWGQAFIVALIFPPLLGAIGLNGAVWLFAAGSFAGALFSFVLCPETKGKSLEQVLKELEGEKHEKSKFRT